MKDIMMIVALFADELYELAQYVMRQGPADPDLEKQLAMRLIRKASDERARREIEG